MRDKRSVVTQAEIVRRETLERVREIDKVLRGTDAVQEVDEGLFGTLVERVRVLNLVQVEFVLRAESDSLCRAVEIGRGYAA